MIVLLDTVIARQNVCSSPAGAGPAPGGKSRSSEALSSAVSRWRTEPTTWTNDGSACVMAELNIVISSEIRQRP